MTDFFCEKLNRKMATDECLSYQIAAAGVTTHACYNCEQGLDVATEAALGASPKLKSKRDPEVPKAEIKSEEASPVETKTCRVCGKSKQMKDFGKNPSSSDGRFHICRECRSEQAIQNQVKIKLTMGNRSIQLDPDLVESVKDLAEAEFRTPLLQAAYMLRNSISKEVGG